MDRLIADSSYLYALFEKDDKNHQRALAFARNNTDIIIVPDVALPEVTYLLMRKGGIVPVAKFMKEFGASSMVLECLTSPDFNRAREIMLAYPESRLDFVDCCIMALSERLGIRQVCTFDRRDFTIFRPAQGDPLELLP